MKSPVIHHVTSNQHKVVDLEQDDDFYLNKSVAVYLHRVLYKVKFFKGVSMERHVR